ncbi:uncharacterized protein LOC143600298 [Bidens hawaiensis]|uniref:uncharacterized protein LOC143600298 n=1 Tax=Bidens hawaiensis TaxID=980011 RepID=UPI00404B4C25
MTTITTTSSPPKETSSVSLQIPTLTVTNYTTWAIKMEAVMDAQGLWESVEPQPGAVGDEKKDKTARAFIFQAIPEDVLLQVAKKKTVKEIWDSLKTRYLGAKRVQRARLHTLKREFNSLKMMDNESIDAFAGKLSGMISRYSSLGETLEEDVLVRKLFDSVPEKYFKLVASIEQCSDIDSMLFKEAIGRLKAYEDRLNQRKRNVTGDNTLLFTRSDGQQSQRGTGRGFQHRGRGRGSYQDRGGRNGSRGRGSSRGRGGRWGDGFHQENQNRKGRDKKHVKCFKCEQLGHYASECPEGNEKRMKQIWFMKKKMKKPLCLASVANKYQNWYYSMKKRYFHAHMKTRPK